MQANSAADVLKATFAVRTWMTGVALVVLTAMVILGGIKSIARVTEWLVPFNDTWSSRLTGAALSVKAFATGLPGTFGDIVVTGGLMLFAYSTLLAWSYYREMGIVHLLGAKAAMPYRFTRLVLCIWVRPVRCIRSGTSPTHLTASWRFQI